jgi:hypothetical protein
MRVRSLPFPRLILNLFSLVALLCFCINPVRRGREWGGATHRSCLSSQSYIFMEQLVGHRVLQLYPMVFELPCLSSSLPSSCLFWPPTWQRLRMGGNSIATLNIHGYHLPSDQHDWVWSLAWYPHPFNVAEHMLALSGANNVVCWKMNFILRTF